MTARDLLRFQFGTADAIRAVAASRAALPTGVLLVLLTAVARSYDQTWIGENPFLWFLGPLLFSLVSGTWLFLVVYAGFVRANWAGDDKFPSVWRDWPAFMGLFWMTAPIAWLYAIPVERFLEDVPAAKANVTLLAIVALWRVLLFSRVVQVVSGVKFLIAQVWVLMAACIETCVIVFFTTFGSAIARGMGGLRNSPAEEIVVGVVNVAMVAAFWTGVVALIAAIFWRPMMATKRLMPRRPERLPWAWLGGLSALWLLAALWAQPAVSRSARAEGLVRDGDYRAALDFLAAHQPGDFAPSRPLPPKTYEWSTFEELAGLLKAVEAKDPEWVRDHLKRRLDEAFQSLMQRRHVPPPADLPLADRARHIRDGFGHWHYRTEHLGGLVEALLAAPWLADWRERQRAAVMALAGELARFNDKDTAVAGKLAQAGFAFPDVESSSSTNTAPPAP